MQQDQGVIEFDAGVDGSKEFGCSLTRFLLSEMFIDEILEQLTHWRGELDGNAPVGHYGHELRPAPKTHSLRSTVAMSPRPCTLAQ